MTQEQLGIDVRQRCWDAEDVTLWQSNVDGILLVERKSIGLAHGDDRKRFLAGLTQFRRAQASATEILGGTAHFSLDFEPALDTPALQAKWREALAQGGYAQADSARFVALPTRDLTVKLELDPAQGKLVNSSDSNVQDSRMLTIALTADGAKNWGYALSGAHINGSARLSYKFLQFLPDSQARVTLYGARVYDFLSAQLHSTRVGMIGSEDEIAASWDAMVKNGSINISITGLDPSLLGQTQQALISSFAAEMRTQLMSVLFEKLAPNTEAGAAGQYRFRWTRRSDAGDLNFSLSAGGWTWLNRSLPVDMSALMSLLDESYLTITSLESSQILTVAVKGDPAVSQVALSLVFSSGHVPETALFGGEGGVMYYPLVSADPRAVRVDYTAKILYSDPGWKPLEIQASATPTNELLLTFDAQNYVRRLNLYLMKRSGDQVEAPTEADSVNYALSARAVWESGSSSAAVNQSFPLSPTQATELALPFDPGDTNQRVTLSIFGKIRERNVVANGFSVGMGDKAIFVVANAAGDVQIIHRDAVIGESDRLAQRLVSAGASLQLVRQQGPSSEAGGDLYVYFPVPLVPQPTTVSCWVASLTMVIDYRDQMSYDPAYVAQAAGMDVNTGYGWNSIRWAVQTWGLIEEGPVSTTPAGWAQMLQNWGPIWIVEVGAPYHAVVVIGIMGDGTPENTWVLVNNPWPPNSGVVEYKLFSDFDYEYGLGAGAYAQLVHG